jgi:hypothetical protein
MSIFDDMYDQKHFFSERDLRELERMLQQAIERGHIEEIQPAQNNTILDARWFRDKTTSEIYCLTPRFDKGLGSWEKVLLKNLEDETDAIQ